MKILVLANSDKGLYKFRKELIQTFLNQGHQVFICLPKGDLIQPLIDMGCHFIETDLDRRGINPILDLKLLFVYLKVMRDIRPDMVITYTVKPNIYGGMACRLLKIPTAINITGLGTAFQKNGFLKRIIVSLYKISCKKAGIIFFENEQNRQIFVGEKIANEEATYKLNGAGVNLEEFKVCEYPEDTGEVRFLFIGRVMREKGINEFFEAAKLIKSDYPNASFHVIGSLEEDYESKIKELEAAKIINYHGYQENIKPFVAQAHCFVLPSYHEGMANTLLECGGMGRPLITSNIYGCKEAVINGESGFLVNVRDSTDLYNKLKKFMELPYEKKSQMGLISRQTIERSFDKKIVVANTVRELGRATGMQIISN